MNFFLDSTFFHNGKDAFQNNKYNEEFMRICRQQGFSIYISEVVLQEVKRQSSIFIKSQLDSIRKGIGAVNQIPEMNISVSIPTLENAMNAFDEHYKKLQDEGNIHIVPYSNDFLPELIHRSIYRIKPFTESKQEFRDAIIWFSYAKIAEEEQLDNCYLISGNSSDYLDKKGEIFKELSEKSNRFTVFKDIYALLEQSFMEEFKAAHEMLGELKQKEWNSEQILEFLNEETTMQKILDFIVDDGEALRYIDIDLYNMSQDKETTYDVGLIPLNPKIKNVDYIDKEFLINGQFEVHMEFDINQKDEKHEKEDFNNKKIEVIIFFDATYDLNLDRLENIEISAFGSLNEYRENVHRIGQDRF